MSTNTPVRKTTATQDRVTTLPQQRTHTPVPSKNHGKVTFAIVSLLAGGVGVAALWMGISAGDEVQVPPLVPSSVQPNMDTSSNAFEHRLQLPTGQSSANAVENANQYNLSPQDWERSMDFLNKRAQAQAQGSGRIESPNIQRPGVAGQSSANAVESQLPGAQRYTTPQERAEAHNLVR